MVDHHKFAMSAIVIFCLALVGSCVFQVSKRFGADKQAAERNAAEWASALGLSVQSVQCMKYDSDDDGYVSCTVSAKNQDGSVQIVPVECSGILSLNEGCRTPKATFKK